MSARIAHDGSAPKPRSKGSAAKSGRRESRKPKTPGLAEQIGVAPETVRRVSWCIFFGTMAALAVAAVAAFRVPQMIGAATAEAVGEAGFVVRGYEIRGVNRMDRGRIDAVVANEINRPMPLVDLAALRQSLIRFGWVDDARVSRRLPDKLVIDIVERRPAAVWQNDRRLVLIDREGVVLEYIRLDALPDLPLVIGPAANLQTGPLNRLLDAVPHLRPQIQSASWVGGRRWDLHFQSNEVLALPEGEEAARRAVRNFARMDQQTQLLGRGFARFDMRIAGRFIVRVSREPGSTVPALAPEPDQAQPADLSTTI